MGKQNKKTRANYQEDRLMRARDDTRDFILRETANMKVREAAVALGVSSMSVTNLRAGEYWSPDMLYRAAKKLRER